MGDGESRQTRVRRWLEAARYAVAAVVTVLTVAVIAWAIVQSMRPEVLYIRIGSGYITVGKILSMSPPVNVKMNLVIKAHNPVGRASIWYHHVSAHILYSNSTEITYLDVEDKLLVGPEIDRYIFVSSNDLQAPGDVSMEFVQKMSKHGYEIKNTTVRLEGIMQTQTSALNYTHGTFTQYYCSPVTIGTSPHRQTEDVPCSAG